MEHQKILNLFNEASDFEFVTWKWNIVNGQSIEIIYNTEVLKSNLCGYNYVCILLRGDITVAAAPATQLSFENCTPFTNIVSQKLME